MLLVVLLVGCAPRTGAAAEADVPRTDWAYRRSNWVDGTVTGVGVGLIAVSTLTPPSPRAKWTGGVLFDDSVRDALRAKSRKGRDRARFVGDLAYRFGALAPTLIDGLLVSLWANQAPDVTAQMLLINLQAYALAGAVLTGSERVFARARPSAEPCKDDSNYERFCGESDQNSAFISGHTGVVATSAGLLCAHHQSLALYGHPGADLAACVSGISLAVTAAVARVVNDRHYATDTLAAFGVGALAGYALPMLSFYAREPEMVQFAFTPWGTGESVGVAAHGSF